eukprot:22690-Amphidinium_carterae.1
MEMKWTCCRPTTRPVVRDIYICSVVPSKSTRQGHCIILPVDGRCNVHALRGYKLLRSQTSHWRTLGGKAVHEALHHTCLRLNNRVLHARKKLQTLAGDILQPDQVLSHCSSKMK